MTEEELDQLVASVTPERLRALALTVKGTFPIGKRTAVPVEALLRALAAESQISVGGEYRQVMARLNGAIRLAVQQMPDARYVERT